MEDETELEQPVSDKAWYEVAWDAVNSAIDETLDEVIVGPVAAVTSAGADAVVAVSEAVVGEKEWHKDVDNWNEGLKDRTGEIYQKYTDYLGSDTEEPEVDKSPPQEGADVASSDGKSFVESGIDDLQAVGKKINRATESFAERLGVSAETIEALKEHNKQAEEFSEEASEVIVEEINSIGRGAGFYRDAIKSLFESDSDPEINPQDQSARQDSPDYEATVNQYAIAATAKAGTLKASFGEAHGQQDSGVELAHKVTAPVPSFDS